MVRAPSTAHYFFFDDFVELLVFDVALRPVLFFEVVDFFDVVRFVLADFFDVADFFEAVLFFEAVDFFEPDDFFDAVDFFDEDFCDEDFGAAGTLPPSRRASERPMAMACLRLVTFFPEPLRSFPRFSSCIVFSTLSCDFFP